MKTKHLPVASPTIFFLISFSTFAGVLGGLGRNNQKRFCAQARVTVTTPTSVFEVRIAEPSASLEAPIPAGQLIDGEIYKFQFHDQVEHRDHRTKPDDIRIASAELGSDFQKGVYPIEVTTSSLTRDNLSKDSEVFSNAGIAPSDYYRFQPQTELFVKAQSKKRNQLQIELQYFIPGQGELRTKKSTVLEPEAFDQNDQLNSHLIDFAKAKREFHKINPTKLKGNAIGYRITIASDNPGEMITPDEIALANNIYLASAFTDPSSTDSKPPLFPESMRGQAVDLIKIVSNPVDPDNPRVYTYNPHDHFFPAARQEAEAEP